MFWTKLSGLATAMATAARIATAGAVGMAALAGAVLIVGPALPGHVVAPWWVSAQPSTQAIGWVPNICTGPRIYYQKHPNDVPPPYCQGTAWYHGSPPPGDAP
jgi:hypothetical protein